MHLLITGGTGFIGVPLVEALLERGDQITLLSRNFSKARELFNGRVNLIGSVGDADMRFDGIINLAGEAIIDKRWTKRRKQQLITSRVGVTEDIIRALAKSDHLPEVFISGSAIGYYGNYPEALGLDEGAQPRQCFSSQLCQDWEAAANQAQALGVRVCTVRTGVVLAQHGGALKRMHLPFRLGLGGRIASGNQWFSWIHLDDMVRLLIFLVDNKTIKGPVNATAPLPVSNAMFAKQFARVLRRPLLLPMPAVVVSALFGEASELLLAGQKVIPKKLLAQGFEFRYPQLDQALRQIILS